MFPPPSLDDELRAHFLHVGKEIGQEDPYEGKETLGIYDVLRVHYSLAQYFLKKGEGIGGVGPRDTNILHSTLSRQFSPFHTQKRWDTKFDHVATLFYGIAKNHAFHDANKRTALLSCILHLSKIRRRFSASHKKIEDFTVRIAENKLSALPEFSDFINKPDAEVRFIAYVFEKRNTPYRLHVEGGDLPAA